MKSNDSEKPSKNHPKERFKTFNIPSIIADALSTYCEQYSLSNSDVFGEAFIEIQKLAEEDFDRFEQAFYSIPPDSSGVVRRSFKISEKYLNFLKKYWFIPDMTCLISRILTWYLREKGLLEKPEKSYKLRP